MEGGKRIRSHFDEFDNEKSHSATKYVRFSDEVISDDSGVVRQLDDDYKSKHTLDSDEEDEAKYEELDVNQVYLIIFHKCYFVKNLAEKH